MFAHMGSAEAKKACRVLVVDDNEDTAQSLAMLLDVEGYDVRMAHDGLAAVKTADEFHPDVALLDIGLPHMSGYDVARHIREHQGADVVLVAITGWGTSEDIKRSMDAGFNHHFTKPADPERLKEIIAREGRAPGR